MLGITTAAATSALYAFSPAHCAMVGWPRSRASLKTRLGLYPSSALERRTQLAITGPMIHGPPYCPYSPTHTSFLGFAILVSDADLRPSRVRSSGSKSGLAALRCLPSW